MRIAFFDMDLTLTRVISAVYLGERLGLKGEVDALEEAVGSRRITDEQFTVGLGELVRGISVDKLIGAYYGMPLIEGLGDAVEALRCRAGFQLEIATGGVGLFAEFLSVQYGFTGCYANSTVLSEDFARIESFGAPFVGGQEKAQYVLSCCAELGVNPMDCLAVGDSHGDVPMFRAVGRSIAINPAEGVEAHHVLCDCKDLREILPYVRYELSSRFHS